MILKEQNNKNELSFDFLSLVLIELKKLNKNPLSSWIKFSDVNYRLGTLYHFDKKSTWKLILHLQQRGFIEINRIKGIRIKSDIDDKNS